MACSNERSRKNEYNHNKSIIVVVRVYNPYTMEIDQRRNYYNCRRFRYITKKYFIGQGRRVKYKNNHNIDNLKEEENI